MGETLTRRKTEQGVQTTCSVDGCLKPHKGRGFCNTHYERWRKHGDPGVGMGYGRSHQQWKGDRVSYDGAHKRIHASRGKAQVCGLCGSVYGVQWALNLDVPADRLIRREHRGSHLYYSTDINDYSPLCLPCHRTQDGCREKVSNSGG